MALDVENIWLYRMVHWENVEYILNNGLCCKEHENADSDYINIGMRSLIEDRHEYTIGLPNAGKLGDYVPFYFAGHSPMLYIIMRGFSGVTKRPQNDIVYVATRFKVIKESKLPYVFTDRHAKVAVANFYTEEEDFKKLNWAIIRAKDWRSDNNNLDKRDLKQAEFLIRNQVPIKAIEALVVKTTERKQYFDEIIANLELEIKVFIDTKNELYY